ncbi:alcohol dehydrogenase catalytic domain-containing protein [Actinopolymorpha alba]|uniref:alcohol dehydrogenase catalytic domain-containing protein n=1 Tax=Actinopolymorpha alba TaxID=533267 RepID=UPI00037ABF25|nr:alcohol dehydrogenase catalytic domain-containing protein [Actinopolymorpha alba]
MPELTRAALWRGGDRFDVVDVPLPVPGPREVLVRVLLATVCGSDHHTVAGRRSGPCPGVLGHEGVGELVACGAGVDIAPGERVVWSVTVACGGCDRCAAGRTAKCRSVRKVGHEAWDSDWPLSGTYAEHLLLPRGASLVRVPPTVSDAVASPAGCATATVMAALDD